MRRSGRLRCDPCPVGPAYVITSYSIHYTKLYEFPPAGLTLAALLVMGWRALPVLMPCAIAATFWIDRIYATHLPARELWVSGILFATVSYNFV